MNTIAEQWATFAAMVMPKDAEPVQRQEMRRAFYAGAEAMLRLQWIAGDSRVTENGAMAMIEGWHDECRRFALQVAAGTA